MGRGRGQPLSHLLAHFYRYDEKRGALVGTRTKRTFEMGQPQKVTIARIDMARRQLDLLLQGQAP